MLWIFDINETMLDLTPLDGVLGSPAAREEWFALVIQGALVSAATSRYRNFAELGAASFRHLRGADASTAGLGATMRALPAHPDVAGGLGALRAAGHRLVALGNSPKAVIDAQLGHSGLEASFDAAYSADQVGALKPSAAPYRFVLEQERVEPSAAVMVAAHGWDIAGAQAAGLRSVFVARPGRAVLPGEPAPDAVVGDFAALAGLVLP
ncbi:haloacid dehalogenase type II [Cryptosporangium japonicum]|uniref:HAD family hydrolase n=1 Tax=Cryptosporangium japonicum TaxID=80872 RepID=A0ABN0TG00_9ACTN